MSAISWMSITTITWSIGLPLQSGELTYHILMDMLSQMMGGYSQNLSNFSFMLQQNGMS